MSTVHEYGEYDYSVDMSTVQSMSKVQSTSTVQSMSTVHSVRWVMRASL
jgi:hypothetical protein